MLRLAVFSDEISQDFRRAAEFAAARGLSAIELRSAWGRAPHELTPPEVQRLKAILGDTGLHLCCIAAPVFRCSLDSRAEVERHFDILRRSVALGRELGCPLVRGFAFRRYGRVEESWGEILDHYEAAIDILDDAAAVLAVENDPATYIGTGRQLRRFLQEQRCPRLRALWNPAHSLADPEGDETPYPEGFRAIEDWIVHVHLLDGVRTPRGFRGVPLGEGAVDYAGQLAALGAGGFAGYAAVEPRWRPPLAPGLSADRARAEAAAAAMTRCLDNLRGLLDRLFPEPLPEPLPDDFEPAAAVAANEGREA